MPRPTVLTPELAAAICERLAECGSLRKVCSDPSMPYDYTVRRWVAADEVFGVAYARAKSAGIDALVEEGLEILDEAPPSTDNGSTDTGHVAWAKARGEYRRWLAERMAPKRYGVNVKQEITGADGGPVKAQILIATGVPSNVVDVNDLV